MLARIAKHLRVKTAGMLVAAAALFFSVGAWAQQPPSSPPSTDKEKQSPASQDPRTANDQPPGPEESSSLNPTVTVNTDPQATPVKVIGDTGTVLNTAGSIFLGRLAIASAEFYQVMDTVSFVGQPGSQTTYRSTFRANIVYDRQFARSRLTLQYQPRLYVIDGRTSQNFKDQNLTFDMFYHLTPRLGMTVNNTVAYYSIQELNGETFFSADSVRGTVLQSTFLDGPGHWIYAQARVGFTYQLDPRTNLSFSPRYSFTQTKLGPSPQTGNPQGFDNTRNSAGFSIAWDRRLTAAQGLGTYYTFGRDMYSSAFHDTIFQTTGVRYSLNITPTWLLHASLGASTSTSTGTKRQWSAVGNLALVKRFERSRLAFAFERDRGNRGLVSNGYGERVDVNYGAQLTTRLQASVGTGYERGKLIADHYSGTYYGAHVNYLLTPSLSWTVYYTYKRQFGGGGLLFIGSRNFVGTGIRWNPRQRFAYDFR